MSKFDKICDNPVNRWMKTHNVQVQLLSRRRENHFLIYNIF